MNNRAYTLLEMLLAVFICLTLSLFTLRSYVEPSYEAYYFMNDYYEAFCKSLVYHQSQRVDKTYYFNESANINRGGSLNIAGHSLIIHLGNAYLFYE